LKKLYETQPPKDPIHLEEDQVFSPIEDLQNITGGRFKNGLPQLSHMPKGIRFIGYFIIGFSVIVGFFAIVVKLFF
jgi:hypothetical protein